MAAVEKDEECTRSGAIPYPATRPRDTNRGKDEGILRHLEEIIRLQGEILYHQRQVLAAQSGQTVHAVQTETAYGLPPRPPRRALGTWGASSPGSQCHRITAHGSDRSSPGPRTVHAVHSNQQDVCGSLCVSLLFPPPLCVYPSSLSPC